MRSGAGSSKGHEERPIAYENVFKALHAAIITGHYEPGKTLTIRGIADDMAVSPMPVREAVRRLVSIGALSMDSSRRVSVSNLTRESFNEVCSARYLIEPALASQAMDRIGREEIRRMYLIDKALDQSIHAGDAVRYSQKNWEFHFTLYNASGSQVLLGFAESLWLRFGPFMRMVVGRIGTYLVADRHQEILAALETRNDDALREAVRLDIYDGMEAIGGELFGRTQEKADLRKY